MIISPDKKGTLDAPTYNLLKEVKTDIPIVQMNGFNDYEFNPDLYKLDKWVLADFSELGANRWNIKESFFWGRNADKFPQVDSDEWRRFDEFVKSKPPVVYLKRELLIQDFGGNVHPINFPCFWEIPPIQTREEFNARPLDVFNVWGYSHELRRMLQGEIFINAVKRNRAVIDNFSHLGHELKDHRKKWLSVFTPHYARFPMNEVLAIQGMAKLSVSLPGAGLTCFRHSEAPINSIMVMRDDPIKWSYDWVHGENCIKFPVEENMESIRGLKGAKEIIEAIEEALLRADLFDIYVNGVETCRKYQIKNYVTKYLEPLINSI